MKNEKICCRLLILGVGYLVLLLTLFAIFYKLIYELAFKGISILTLNFGEYPGITNFYYLLIISDILIILGYYIKFNKRCKIPNLIEIFKKILDLEKNLLPNLLFFMIFLIEVMLSTLAINLIIIQRHLSVGNIIVYSLSIIIAFIFTKSLENRLQKLDK